MQITKRVYIIVTVLIVVPVTLAAILIPVEMLRVQEAQRKQELLFVASSLGARLSQAYDEISEHSQAQGKSSEEQVWMLNQVLQPVINDFNRYYPDLSLGYYSLNFDRIVAVGPNFQAQDLQPIPHDELYFKIYKSGQPNGVRSLSPVFYDGKTGLRVAVPIYRDGRVIGHTWVNTKLDDIYADIGAVVRKILLIGLFVLVVALWLSWRMFDWFSQELVHFADALVHHTYDPSDKMLPEFNPILDVVKQDTDELLLAFARLQEEVAVRESAETELKRSRCQSEERFFKVFNAAPSMMLLIRCQDWQIVEANESFLEVSGWSREEVIGSRSEDLDFWAIAAERSRFREMIGKKEGFRNSEMVFITKNHTPRALLVSAERIDLAVGHCALVAMTDITERKQWEREMLRLDRLNLLAEMAAGISHEVRNPLTTIRGFLQMLKMKPDCQSYNGYYDLMIEELDRANSIITEFLSIGRNNLVEQKIQSLNTLIQAIAPLIQADALGQDKSLVLELGDIPNLSLNESEMRQVVLNLSRNAVEAMKPGGVVRIKTYCELQEVVLAVEDEGAGMPPEVLERIGTPFLTTKEQGTGLGLPVCYSIAARHKARITVNTGLYGTTFYVRFQMLQANEGRVPLREKLAKGES